MKILSTTLFVLCLCSSAEADFSYTQTRKTTGGMMAAMGARGGGPQQSKVMMKGRKMKTDDGNVATIIDLDAQTITAINYSQKTYTVKGVGDGATATGDMNLKVDVKETGQTKNIHGFNASEALMTMEMDMPQMGKAHMEIDTWLSADVPGVEELRSFYAKNAEKFPWRALGGGNNPGLANAMAELQKKMATMKGAPVEQIIRMKMAGGGMPGGAGAPAGPSAAQMSQMSAGMEKARKQLEAMVAQGGPAAAIAKQQLDRMGPAPGAGGSAAPSASNWLMEMTVDSSDFSSAPIPDSAFAIPAGYQKN